MLRLSSDPVNPGGPPYQLAENSYSILRFSDLIFVDPVGTGYSRALGKKKDSDYWGVDEDSASVADFIRKYLTKNNRWNSPKFLAGESYGTIRASVLIRDMELKLLDSVTFDGEIRNMTELFGLQSETSFDVHVEESPTIEGDTVEQFQFHVPNQHARTDRAIAFPCQKFWRIPSIIFREIFADEICDRRRIFINSPVI